MTKYADVQPYVTKDGSVIRELMHPEAQGNLNQSLAEAIVPVGGSTILHRHRVSEEIYHVTAGHGRMTLDEATFQVEPGDTIAIPPGSAHRIENTGGIPLHILCCSAPAYSHDDTDLL